MAAALDDNDLEVAGAHVDVEALESNLDETVESYRRLECDQLVLPYLEEVTIFGLSDMSG